MKEKKNPLRTSVHNQSNYFQIPWPGIFVFLFRPTKAKGERTIPGAAKTHHYHQETAAQTHIRIARTCRIDREAQTNCTRTVALRTN